MRDLIFWGATGQSKVLKDALYSSDYRLVAIVDNRELASPFDDVTILRGEEGLDMWLKDRGKEKPLFCAVAIGGSNGRDRLELMGLLKKKGLTIIKVIHPTAFIANTAFLGEGCQVLAQAAVCTHVRLGKGVIVNTASSVDHDCIIGDGVHLAPGARLAGGVHVADRSFVGSGAVILPHVKINADSIVGAGAVVIKDVPKGATVVGNPARILYKSDIAP